MAGKAGSRLVHGVGYNDGKYSSKDGNKTAYIYGKWQRMLERCYNDKSLIVKPTYIGCSVSDSFKEYTLFHEWYITQIGSEYQDWQLDKDLLIRNNKVYSEEYCVLLPKDINTLIIKNDARRGDWPIGVSKHKRDGTYSATCNYGKKIQKYLGSFDTPLQAFLCYKKAKEAYIKQVAEQYKSQIDPRAYKALIEYEVHITD
jgi:hypothetical protein